MKAPATLRAQICSPTSFWVVDLAAQMERLGCLTRFCTALPARMTPQILAEKTRRQPLLLAPSYATRFLKSRRVQDATDAFIRTAFERWLAGKVEACDIFHCLSGVCLKPHRVAKTRFGAVTVCDRGSSHIRYQDTLLREEFARFGVPYRGPDERALQKEEAEYAECDLITVPSSFALRSFLERGVPAHKLARLPFGVDLSQFRRVPKDDRVFRVVCVGQLSLRKGTPYLLDAIRDFPAKDFEVVFIGSCSDEVKTLVERNRASFKYLGPIPRADLYRHYSQGSVFVIASVEEGLAMVQAQAMACGLPVIATTNTGAEDLFTDGVEGFIVPARDPQAIRERLLCLYENPSIRDRMAEAALSRVSALGGWDQYGDAALLAYRDALDRRHTTEVAASTDLSLTHRTAANVR